MNILYDIGDEHIRHALRASICPPRQATCTFEELSTWAHDIKPYKMQVKTCYPLDCNESDRIKGKYSFVMSITSKNCTLWNF